MAEISKCPVCGENPKCFPIAGWESGWKTDMLMCCGYGSTSVKGWNKYAAAMELALASVNVDRANFDTDDTTPLYEAISDAEQRVLEGVK